MAVQNTPRAKISGSKLKQNAKISIYEATYGNTSSRYLSQAQITYGIDTLSCAILFL
ncbi:MAG TPA: hypothetical protein VE956_10540 [Nodularia sp. (in: cyanobacteria)]|nr:hypothetical protein [Nodularia sp. (in: cyanobacteria)]